MNSIDVDWFEVAILLVWGIVLWLLVVLGNLLFLN